MSDPITCNLAQNALDYLILAGEQAQEGSPGMLKHSVATLADGVELLLKARLEMYDWCLLFKNVDSADKDKYQSGDFQSVTVEQTVNRLKNICDISIEDKHLKILDTIRRLRNKIRHFAVSTNREEAISLITKTYSFAIDFTTNHLESQYGENIKQEMDTIRRMLGEFDDFVASRNKEIQQTIQEQSYAWHVECPKCTQETLYPDGGNVSCAFCGYNKDSFQATQEWIHYMYNPSWKDLASEEYIHNCPECSSYTLVYDENNESYLCLSCGESAELKGCDICGTPTFSGLCDYCEYKLSKDD